MTPPDMRNLERFSPGQSRAALGHLTWPVATLAQQLDVDIDTLDRYLAGQGTWPAWGLLDNIATVFALEDILATRWQDREILILPTQPRPLLPGPINYSALGPKARATQIAAIRHHLARVLTSSPETRAPHGR